MKAHARNIFSILAAGLGGCRSMQYKALESVGIEKRGLLEARVEAETESLLAAMRDSIAEADRFIKTL